MPIHQGPAKSGQHLIGATVQHRDIVPTGVTADTRLQEYREFLTYALENSAAWRSSLVERFPHDQRNEAAARELYSLAKTMKDVPDRLIEEYIAFGSPDSHADNKWESAMIRNAERQNEALRSVGFTASYRDAAEFVRHLVLT